MGAILVLMALAGCVLFPSSIRQRADGTAKIAFAASHPGPLHYETLNPNDAGVGQIGAPVWCARVYDETNSFSKVTIVFAKRASFLTPETVKKYADAVNQFTNEMTRIIRKDRALNGKTNDTPLVFHTSDLIIDHDKVGGDSLIRMIPMRDGRTAHVCVAGFGPGGAAFAASFPTADNCYDLFVLTSTSFEGKGLTPLASALDYQKRLKEQPYQLIWDIAMVVDGLYTDGTLKPDQRAKQVPKRSR